MNAFAEALRAHGLRLERRALRVLQLNLGRTCNLSCVHCHVSAGPNRTESMSTEVAERCLQWIRAHRPETVDLTGGEPELCPSFRDLARGARACGAAVIVRTNLTVFFERGHQDLPQLFRELELHVIASMPCYLEQNVDAQRGAGVYARSIAALRQLNDLGYGRDPRLVLDLMYNPGQDTLPPDQAALERDYRRELGERHGIGFDHLLCLANLPVGRFASGLRARDAVAPYEERLCASFNPATVPGLMCRDTLSVGWRGDLFDCDFNQMLDLSLSGAARTYLWDVDPRDLAGRAVATARHCFGCTSGQGSSCGGALT